MRTKYLFVLATFIAAGFTAQTLTNKKNSEIKFTVVKNLDATAVQNQQQTDTCWSFSSLSFFESEFHL